MKQPTIVRSLDDYRDRFWRIANIGRMTRDRSRQIAESLNNAGVVAYAALDKAKPVVHVESPDVLGAVRKVLAYPWCPLCGTHHEPGDGPAGYSCEGGR